MARYRSPASDLHFKSLMNPSDIDLKARSADAHALAYVKHLEDGAPDDDEELPGDNLETHDDLDAFNGHMARKNASLIRMLAMRSEKNHDQPGTAAPISTWYSEPRRFPWQSVTGLGRGEPVTPGMPH
jgi:hypothetical protein